MRVIWQKTTRIWVVGFCIKVRVYICMYVCVCVHGDMDGHVCVQLNPQPVTEPASGLCSAPRQGRHTQLSVVRMLGMWWSKLDQEAVKSGRGRFTKGLVCLAKGGRLHVDSGDKPL